MATLKKENMNTFLQNLGEDAIKAFENNTEWEYIPESIEFGNFIPFHDGDCWLPRWYVTGYRIENQQIFETIHSCDGDDWYYNVDDRNILDPNINEWRKLYDLQTQEETLEDYYYWVLNNNQDPLKQLYLINYKPKQHQVTIHLINQRFVVKHPKKLSHDLKDYLLLNGNNEMDVEWTTIDQLVNNYIFSKIVSKKKIKSLFKLTYMNVYQKKI